MVREAARRHVVYVVEYRGGEYQSGADRSGGQAIPTVPPAGRIALFLGSGVLFGLALRSPGAWPAAWLALACLGAALASTRSVWQAFVGTLGGAVIARAIAFPWLFDAIAVSFPGPLLERLRIFGVAQLAWSMPGVVAITLAYGLLRRGWVVFWLPPAWALGEWIRTRLTSVTLDDWLATQWQNDVVLRSLGHLGWWPTLVISLVAAVGLGEAVIRRRAALAGPLAAWCLVLAALPALPTTGNRVLDGVAAVHTDSAVALPEASPRTAALSLVVWPEVSFHLTPTMPEGRHEVPLGLPALLAHSRAQHLVGLDAVWPGQGRQNRLVLVDAAGRARASRGKSRLFPIHEREWFGLGQDRYEPGQIPPILTASGRQIIPLICGEVLERDLVAQGRALGGELLVVSASEWVTPSPLARRQILALQALRSAEFGVPSVRASRYGAAAIIGADGRLLARSDETGRGLLTWQPDSGPIAIPFRPEPAAQPAIAVLFSIRDVQQALLCPDGRCSYHALEGFECGRDRADTVVIAGHSLPPRFAGQTPEALAAAVACFEPKLVVVNTCFGATSTLMEALSPLGATVVAAPSVLREPGLRFDEAFFEKRSVAERIAAISAPDGGGLYRGVVTRAELAAGRTELASLTAVERRGLLVSATPPLLAMALPGGRVLTPAADEDLQMTDTDKRTSLRERFGGVRARLSGSKTRLARRVGHGQGDRR